MRLRAHMGVSLDGFVATADGLPAWEAMPTFSPESYGIATFTAQCEALIMGRTSFDQGFADWLPNWPWPEKQLYVLTSRPLPATAPPGVSAAQDGPEALLKQLRDADLTRGVQMVRKPSRRS